MEQYRNKKVFISGGAGVIGAELVNLLTSYGAILFVGDLKSRPKEFPNSVMYRQGDLNFITQEELERFKPEIFFHLAATFERSTESYSHWEENFHHNIKLSNHLMTLLRNITSLRRVVYASSYLIYDKSLYTFDHAKNNPVSLKETDPIFPRNLTGLAKLSHEIELEFLKIFKKDQFSSVSVRIYRGYGKNSRDIISRWIRSCLKGEDLKIFRPEGWFDYLYAADSAEGLARIALTSFDKIVNLGTGRSRKVSDVIDILKSYFPDILMQDIESNIPYEASQADITLFHQLTSWKPVRDLEDTIPEIIDYEKKLLDLKDDKLPSNILVTSVSGKVPLLRELRKATNKVSTSILIYGADVTKNCIGKYFVDSFWNMPYLSDLPVGKFMSYCRDHGIGSVIPTRDGELEYFATHKQTMEDNGIHIMVSSKNSIIRCIDKLAFAQFGRKSGLPIIPTSTKIDDLEGNYFVVKERFGAGAKAIGINLNREQSIEHAKTLKNPIFQPFLPGKEYSVDAYVDKKKQVKGLVIRERVLVIDGESQITTIFPDKGLEKKLIEIIVKLNLYGHLVLQIKLSENGGINIIECNSRFGGASSASIAAGLDSFYWFILEANGEDISNYPFLRSEKEITQIRYKTDHYI